MIIQVAISNKLFAKYTTLTSTSFHLLDPISIIILYKILNYELWFKQIYTTAFITRVYLRPDFFILSAIRGLFRKKLQEHFSKYRKTPIIWYKTTLWNLKFLKIKDYILKFILKFKINMILLIQDRNCFWIAFTFFFYFLKITINITFIVKFH